MKKSFKEQCIELRKKDKTLNEIVAITGRSKTTVYFHIKNIKLSDTKKAEITKQYRESALRLSGARRGIAQKPYKKFSTWNPQRVLLVAHLIFDGELRRTTCGYSNRSQSLISRVECLFNEIYEHPPRRHYNRQTGVHKIYYHNVEMGTFMLQKADELLETIARMPKTSQLEFLRAFFDDEGSMDYRPKQNKRRIRGYQKDRKILVLVQALLKNFTIESKVREPNEVVITGKENLKRFQREINFSPGVCLNPKRANSIWKKPIEKRVLLDRAIMSFKT